MRLEPWPAPAAHPSRRAHVIACARFRTRRSERESWIDHKSIVMPILALQNISKRFGAIVIADGLDLELTEGEALGIIGPNGAGKTTLFGIMTGTVAADAGRVLLDGADITRLPLPRRCTMG